MGWKEVSVECTECRDPVLLRQVFAVWFTFWVCFLAVGIGCTITLLLDAD